MNLKKIKIGIIAALVVLAGAFVALAYTGQTTFIPVVAVLMLALIAFSLGMMKKKD